jgi:hypothetical protein
MLCEQVRKALGGLEFCEESESGARVPTHCLYPSFEPVHVHVVRFGDGFKVHDGGGAFRSAWDHGRESVIITRCLNQEATRFHLVVKEATLIADVPNVEWLSAAMLSVSNASAAAATNAVAHFNASAESDLVTRIHEALIGAFSAKMIAREFLSVGKSGKEYRFDFGVRSETREFVLINAVSPHHASIASKYVAFADGASDAVAKFAVYDRELESDDVSLLQQVAEIVPFSAVIPGTRRALAHER